MRLIDADELLKKIESRIGYFNEYFPQCTDSIRELELCKEFINDAPTVEVKLITYAGYEKWTDKVNK